MKVWSFKNYTSCESYRENKNLVKKWFYQCECKQHYKELFAFLYGLQLEELLDDEVNLLIEEIDNKGFNAFLKQYYQFRHLGFNSKIILLA